MDKIFEIMIIEDNDGDVFLAKKAFETLEIAHNISVAFDGEQAMDMLNRVGEYTDIPRPDIILLDLNLPGRDGKRILKDIKSAPHLKRIPVFVLSSSKSPEDVLEAYNDLANVYICKPQTINDFRELVAAMKIFWIKYAIIPHE